MQIKAIKGKLESQAVDLLIVNLFQGVTKPGGATGAVDKALSKLLTRLIAEEKFTGKLNQTLLVRNQASPLPAKKILLVGLGKKACINTERIRQVTATSLKLAKKINAKTVASILHGAGEGKIKAFDAAYAMATGLQLADYSFTKYQVKKAKLQAKLQLKSFTIVDHNKDKVSAANVAITVSQQSSVGINLGRDLVNEPGLLVTPKYLVNQALKLASASSLISCQVLDEKKLEKLGAGALLAVSRGSVEPAFLIHLTYTPKTKNSKRIALLGKGLTFDTGGYSLKPSSYMSTMKIDMGGAATVLGIFAAITATKPEVEIHGIIPTSENLISGKAIKPGDVVTSLSGKTIEILNTDAEGRLILADALAFISHQKWDAIIDFATLTGACMVALGDQVAGLFSNDDQLQDALLSSAKAEDEKIWPLPLVSAYKKSLESNIADIQNISKGKYAGAITAALFLKEFVPVNTPWAHLDIAGPAYADKDFNPYTSAGGTGFAIRTILHFLKNWK